MEQLPMKETVDLRTIFATIWRRKLVVVLPTVLAVLTAWVVTLPQIMKPVYECHSVLLVQPPPQLSNQLASLVVNPTQGEQIVRLQSQIRSNEFLDKVITQTGLRQMGPFRDWARRNKSRYEGMSEDQLIDLRAKEFLRQGVVAASAGERGGPGNQVVISLQMSDADQVFALVNNITRSVIDAGKADLNDEFQWTSAFSELQRQEYRTRLDKAEKELEDFRRQALGRVSTPSVVGENNALAAQQLRSDAEAAQTLQEDEVERLGGELRRRGVDPATVDRLLLSAGIAPALNEARELERNYIRQRLLGVGDTQGSAIQSARKADAIEQAGRAALGTGSIAPASLDLAAQYFGALVHRDLARAGATAVADEIGKYQGRLSAEPEVNLQLQRLMQEVESNRSILNAFEAQMVSSQVSTAYGSSKAGEKISILVPAQRPLDPVWPKRTPIILLSVLAGLGLGIGAVFFLEQHDPSFRDVRDLERSFGLRVLGTIPNISGIGKLARGPSPATGNGTARAAQAERVMRNFLDDSPAYREFRKVVLGLVRTGGPDPRKVMVTSARMGEGKSVASLCLAFALAREFPSERVVLVDLDTRRGGFEAFNPFGGGPGAGSLVLSSRTWEGNPLTAMVLPNLWLLVPADAKDAAQDVVTVENVRWLLAKLGEVADRVVFDSPPNLPLPDSIVIGPEVDAVLMVVKAGETPRETARLGLELQRRFADNVAGILMNNLSDVLPYYHQRGHQGYGSTRRG
jgi:polysaccharide biosynthesis transport protein